MMKGFKLQPVANEETKCEESPHTRIILVPSNFFKGFEAGVNDTNEELFKFMAFFVTIQII